jgi:RNA polymerase sigma-70 factor (ECF subfamily)
VFGVHNLALAEDVVQDAFCRAAEIWKVRGVPENPSAWLMTTAKNRALDVVRRERTARTFAPEISRRLETEWTLAPTVAESFDAPVIRDEQLRMMFSCCQPSLPENVQVALVLNILCGFGANEIANAFLTGRAAIGKRISRGKKALASSKRLFDLSDADFAARLSSVRRALYLLFNEGYHGASAESAVRADLCREAIGLVTLLLEHPPAATPETNALAALMCLHAARLPARVDEAGDLSPLVDQDRSRWDAKLVARGLTFFEASGCGTEVSAYHVEAAIAAVHAGSHGDDVDWDTIVGLYDRLMRIAPSPVVALNRAIAIGQRDGADTGIAALEAIADVDRLEKYPFHAAALAELELSRGDRERAREHFSAALALARNAHERRFLQRRMRQARMSTTRITREYTAQYENPISAREGEFVDIQREDDTYRGWWWCVAADGRAGWVPLERLSQTVQAGTRAPMLADYTALELTVTVGEELVIEEELRGWLYVRNASAVRGWIPASHTDRGG